MESCARCGVPLPYGYRREDGAVMSGEFSDLNTWVWGCEACSTEN